MKINSKLCKKCSHPKCTGRELHKLGYKIIKCKYDGKYIKKKI